MSGIDVTKRDLGSGYVAAAGAALSIGLLAHATVALRTEPMVALVAAAGSLPAVALVAASRWLPTNGLDDDQMWTVAQWTGLGIALLTLVNLGVLVRDPPSARTTPVLLGVAVALAGLTGLLLGAILELRRTTRRLERGNAVLGRVIQHNLRNDLTVVLGHVGELRRDVSGDAADRVDRLAESVDHIVSTAEKARQIDVALDADRRPRRSVDVVPYLEQRLAAVESSHPEAVVETDVPASAPVSADWFVKTVLDNVIENAVVHAPDAPRIRVTVERDAEHVVVRVVDECPPIPENEHAAFSDAVETRLDHATGVGLWLVRFVMESYGGEVSYERTDDGANAVELLFEAGESRAERSKLDRMRLLLGT